MRLAAALALGFLSSTAFAQPAPDKWDLKAREIFARSIEIPTVPGRGQMPAQARYLAYQFRAGGFPEADIKIMPYQARPGDETAALIVRWRASKPSGKKPILLLAHMDVVEALPADWSADPFKFREEGGYFYGRGALDNKAGMVAITTALLRLRSEGFAPSRDLIVFFTGDEETEGKGAALGAKEWREWTDAEFALNSDAGGGAFTRDGGRSASASRRPRRPIRASPSRRGTGAATARGLAPTMRSTTWRGL
jgi:acetylornithine deacetylase/succinyl-diaminopimelate desuccinylase-like protein